MKYFKFSLLLFALSLLLGIGACKKKQNDNPNPQNPGAGLNASTAAQDAAGNRYEVGFDQATSINQNPFVRKINASGQEVWRIIYENTPVDGRAVWVAINSNQKPYVVFTVDGGSNDAGAINKKELDNPNAFSGVFQSGYGSGGGPKASIIARLNPDNGKIEKATFVAARLTDGKTNTLNITKFGFQNNKVAFEVSSAAWPPGEGSSFVRFPNITDADRVDGAFKIYYEMNLELSAIEKAVLLKN